MHLAKSAWVDTTTRAIHFLYRMMQMQRGISPSDNEWAVFLSRNRFISLSRTSCSDTKRGNAPGLREGSWPGPWPCKYIHQRRCWILTARSSAITMLLYGTFYRAVRGWLPEQVRGNLDQMIIGFRTWALIVSIGGGVVVVGTVCCANRTLRYLLRRGALKAKRIKKRQQCKQALDQLAKDLTSSKVTKQEDEFWLSHV